MRSSPVLSSNNNDMSRGASRLGGLLAAQPVFRRLMVCTSSPGGGIYEPFNISSAALPVAKYPTSFTRGGVMKGVWK
ncbi:MAG: hypothetical protein ACK55Z_19425, partial [bacterium]